MHFKYVGTRDPLWIFRSRGNLLHFLFNYFYYFDSLASPRITECLCAWFCALVEAGISGSDYQLCILLLPIDCQSPSRSLSHLTSDESWAILWRFTVINICMVQYSVSLFSALLICEKPLLIVNMLCVKRLPKDVVDKFEDLFSLSEKIGLQISVMGDFYHLDNVLCKYLYRWILLVFVVDIFIMKTTMVLLFKKKYIKRLW